MLVNKSTVMTIFTNLKTTFHKAFTTGDSQWKKIAMLVTSTGAQNTYAWLDRFPIMKKWIGEKSVKSLAAHSYTIVNDDYEATVEVDRNDIEDDQLGQYAVQAQAAGDSAKALPDMIVSELVINGKTNLCFDGQPFFDEDHPAKDKDGEDASISNISTNELKVATLAEAKASYGHAYTAMQLFCDDEGESLDVKPDVLLVGPQCEAEAKVLMNADKLKDGEPNPYYKTAEVVVNRRIKDKSWFLLDTSKPVKPFIYQERKKPTFVSQTDMNASDVFSRRKYKFGVEARVAGGYGFWQLAFGNIPAS